MNHLELKVDGMHCASCTGRLQRVLEGERGIAAAQIVLETKRVGVDFDATLIDADAIRTLIDEAGFTVLAA